MTLGELIKDTMRERGIKASVVARKMNVSRQTINQIDARKKFDIEFLQKLKEASGMDFTQYAYNGIASSQEAVTNKGNLGEAGCIHVKIAISFYQESLDNLPKFLKELETLSKSYGYRLS